MTAIADNEAQIEYWGSLFNAAENAEERKEVWDIAEASKEAHLAAVAMMRITDPKRLNTVGGSV